MKYLRNESLEFYIGLAHGCVPLNVWDQLNMEEEGERAGRGPRLSNANC